MHILITCFRARCFPLRAEIHQRLSVSNVEMRTKRQKNTKRYFFTELKFTTQRSKGHWLHSSVRSSQWRRPGTFDTFDSNWMSVCWFRLCCGPTGTAAIHSSAVLASTLFTVAILPFVYARTSKRNPHSHRRAHPSVTAFTAVADRCLCMLTVYVQSFESVAMLLLYGLVCLILFVQNAFVSFSSSAWIECPEVSLCSIR